MTKSQITKLNARIKRVMVIRNEAPSGCTIQKMANKELDSLYNLKYGRSATRR